MIKAFLEQNAAMLGGDQSVQSKQGEDLSPSACVSGNYSATSAEPQNGVSSHIESEIRGFMKCDATREAMLKALQDGSAPPMIKAFLEQNAAMLGSSQADSAQSVGDNGDDE